MDYGRLCGDKRVAWPLLHSCSSGIRRSCARSRSEDGCVAQRLPCRSSVGRFPRVSRQHVLGLHFRPGHTLPPRPLHRAVPTRDKSLHASPRPCPQLRGARVTHLVPTSAPNTSPDLLLPKQNPLPSPCWCPMPVFLLKDLLLCQSWIFALLPRLHPARPACPPPASETSLILASPSPGGPTTHLSLRPTWERRGPRDEMKGRWVHFKMA